MKLFLIIVLLLNIILFCYSTDLKSKKKKNVVDMTDREIEALYDEWEENDKDQLPDDEKPPHLRPKPKIDFDSLKKKVNF